MDNLIKYKKEIYELKKEVKDLKNKLFTNKCIFSDILNFMIDYKEHFEEDEDVLELYDKITEVNIN